MGLFGPGKEPPVIKPKPKTRAKPKRVIHGDHSDGPTPESPGATVWVLHMYNVLQVQ